MNDLAAVFFDFAGTLFDDRALRDVHLQQLRFVAAAAEVEATDEQLRAAYRTGVGIAYRSTATQPWYLHRTLFAGAFAAMADSLGSRISAAVAQEAVDRQVRATIGAANLRPDCLATLGALRAAGLHVQIVSNIDDEQLQPMLDRLDLRDVIDAATSSESAGSCKPNAAIYRVALGKAGVDPGRVLFVGDSLGHDVAGPFAIGMRTAWLAPQADPDSGDVHPDAVIHSLAEVLDLVGLPRVGSVSACSGAAR